MITTGRTALVTGASSGIGREFAQSLARSGVDLILVARSAEALTAIAAELSARHSIRAEAVVADLSREHSPEAVMERIHELGMTVDVLVNNAGFATQGRFADLPAGLDHRQVMVNVVAVLDLARAVLPSMIERHCGAVVNVASIGAFQPAPRLAVYAASKAFVLSFSTALTAELRGTGVRVLALCPGPVHTNFFEVLGSRDAAIGQVLPVGRVVEAALAGLRTGRVMVVPGWRNRMQVGLVRLLPRRVVLAVATHATRRGVSG